MSRIPEQAIEPGADWLHLTSWQDELMAAIDTLGRQLRDLRISVTDRCNFRCVYCMPKEVFGRDYQFLERAELLTFEEIERVARSSWTSG